MAQNREKRKPAASQKASAKFRGGLMFFISFAVILFVFIIYYSFSRTIILITPRVTPLEESFFVVVAEDPDQQDSPDESLIKGLLLEKETADFLAITDLGSPQEIPARAEGRVTVYNDWSQVQPLAATTRLLSEEGLLFRTRERVDVPAKSSIEVEVYADEEGAEGNIEPTKFTIPGLSAQMQELVWAESSQAMTGGTKLVNQITPEMVLKKQDQLIAQIKENNLKELEKEARETDKNYSISLDRIETEILEKDVEPPIGSESESLVLTMKLKLIAVAFSEKDLEAVVKDKLEKNIASGFTLSSDNFRLSYALETFNLAERTAKLKVSARADSLLKLSNPIFERKNVTSKDRQEIRAYFLDFEGIEEVEVKFSPFWVFRAPKLEDHIEIRFK